MSLKGDLIMKTKNERSPRLLPHGDRILDRGLDDVPDTRESWLDEMYHEKPRSQKRAIAAELFLQTRLFPRVEEGQSLDEQILADLLVDFRRSYKAGDVQFEMAQVAARLLSRFQCHLLDDEHLSLPARSGALEREFELFTSLSALDFQRIDQTVRKRLHSG
jgi:hypothetical protein